MSRWYVIQCKPREEHRALANLERQRFSCYLPMLNVEKLRHGCRRDVAEPLFPGYLFIHLNELSDNWHPIRSTRGVIQLVRVREYPIPLPDEMIAIVRQRLAGNELRRSYLEPGDRVRITEGPFSEIEAIFVANEAAHQRVAVLLNFLQREHRL